MEIPRFQILILVQNPVQNLNFIFLIFFLIQIPASIETSIEQSKDSNNLSQIPSVSFSNFEVEIQIPSP